MMCSGSGWAQRTAEDACRLRTCAAAATPLCAGAGWQFVDAGGSCREQAPAAPVSPGSRDLGDPRTSALLSGLSGQRGGTCSNCGADWGRGGTAVDRPLRGAGDSHTRRQCMRRLRPPFSSTSIRAHACCSLFSRQAFSLEERSRGMETVHVRKAVPRDHRLGCTCHTSNHSCRASSPHGRGMPGLAANRAEPVGSSGLPCRMHPRAAVGLLLSSEWRASSAGKRQPESRLARLLHRCRWRAAGRHGAFGGSPPVHVCQQRRRGHLCQLACQGTVAPRPGTCLEVSPLCSSHLLSAAASPTLDSSSLPFASLCCFLLTRALVFSTLV